MSKARLTSFLTNVAGKDLMSVFWYSGQDSVANILEIYTGLQRSKLLTDNWIKLDGIFAEIVIAQN